jgi:endonuclease YncB( thermonuclease family)
MMTKPQSGFITDAKVLRVIDADTIEVEITRRFPLRLTHSCPQTDYKVQFNAPEKNTAEGQDAIDFVKDLLDDHEVTVFIPAGRSDSLTDINSFNRLLGNIWVDGKGWLTNLLLENGHGELK